MYASASTLGRLDLRKIRVSRLSMASGILYIVATPIGNLEDITLRALRVLKEVDLIAAEDTRHSRKLLSHFGISKPLTSYFDHNKGIKGAAILERLQEGLSVALITDAGTPCISDPGYQLVRDALAAGIRVVPIPGPTAAMAALSASGLPSDSFVFAGFLPNRRGKRRDRLLLYRDEPRVVIFYEAPQRLMATLEDIETVCGDREMVVARELTKIYEEFVHGRVGEVMAHFAGGNVKGEVVILLSPPSVVVADPADVPVTAFLAGLLAEGMTLKDAVRRTVEETGSPRGMVYAEALRLRDSMQ
jgi:16S rRNA (cytidine1402-2'-O)-methyltransferase